MPESLNSTDNTSFYITGGTLPPEASSYVTRQADTDLYQSLMAGEYCYVLNSRQMGKSSLCVRAIGRLQGASVRTVFVDLTKLGGSNLSAEQWYAGMLSVMGRELGLRSEFMAYWKAQASQGIGPLPRLFGALEEVALPASESSVVVFIDEIDATRSLPFSADEFFIAIRQLYVERAVNPALKRLTFCLLGTAAPSDLIADTRVSPFNIGRRVDVTDFTVKEAAPLAEGLNHGRHGEKQTNHRGHREHGGVEQNNVTHQSSAAAQGNGAKLLARVLYWTNGHPYLTQRLCSAIVEASLRSPSVAVQSASAVDKLCADLFLTHTAKESDNNLTFVRDRLLKSEAEVAAVLDMYARIRQGKSVADDDTDPLCSVLKLSGAARVENGVLRVRNRIYERVFDRQWIINHTSDAEMRRQQTAYRRGVQRTLALTGAVLVVFAGLTAFAFQQRNNALHNARVADEKTTLANTKTQEASDKSRQREELAQQRAIALSQALAQQKRADLNAATAEKQTALALKNAANARKQASLAAASSRAAHQQTILANKNAAEARSQAVLARRRTEEADSNLYADKMNLIQREWDSNSIDHLLDLLKDTAHYKGRGFEWGYWNRMCHLDLKTLEGHVSSVNSVAFSPDGRYIATGSYDRSVKIWEAQTGRTVLTLTGHKGSIRSVTFSPDGRRLVTGSSDHTARIWDAQSGRELLTLSTDGGMAVLSPDGKHIATSGDGETARIWDAQTGRPLLTLSRHTKSIYSLAFSPDGRRIATGSRDEIKVWDAQTGRDMLTFTTNSGWQPCVAFSPDNKRIAIGSWGGIVYDAVTGREVLTLHGYTNSIRYLVFSPDGKRIATGSGDYFAKVWDAATGEELWTIKGHKGGVNAVTFSPDGKHLATGSDDNTAKIWDAEASHEALTVPMDTWEYSAAFSLDSKSLVTGGSNNTARLWNVETGALLRTFKGHTRMVSGIPLTDKTDIRGLSSVTFSSDGKHLATGSGDSTAKIWDAQTGRELRTFKGHRSYVTSVAFSPDGKHLVTGSYDKLVKIWDVRTGALLLTLKGHTDAVNSVAFSPDGRRLVSGSDDHTARVWDAASGLTLWMLKGHAADVASVAFSLDGNYIATGSGDHTARIWNARTGHEWAILKGYDKEVSTVAFSPDSKRLITSDKLWDIQTGQELLTLQGNMRFVNAVTFSPNGKYIAMVGSNSNAKIWFSDMNTKQP